jgi:hypothetical protein
MLQSRRVLDIAMGDDLRQNARLFRAQIVRKTGHLEHWGKDA